MRPEPEATPSSGAPAGLATPPEPEGLTPAWLTQALRCGGVLRRASVVALEAGPLGPGQGLTGRLARLRVRYDVEEPGAPGSLIAKFPAGPGPIRELGRMFRLYQREARFYQELAPRAGLPTPRLYWAAETSDGLPVLLLQDLTEASPGDLLAGCNLARAEHLLGWLARMHAAWWASPELERLPWLPTPNDALVVQFIGSRGPDAWDTFLRRFRRHLPPPLMTLGKRMQRNPTVLDRLAAPPLTLVHGDFRLNNLLFAASDGPLLAVLDWQTAVRGRGPMDVACLFASSLSPADRREAERELLPRYHRALLENGVRGYSFQQCWEDYRLAVINLFSQIVFLNAVLDMPSLLRDEVEPVTGQRLLSALLELDPLELLPSPSPWRRWASALGWLLGRPA